MQLARQRLLQHPIPKNDKVNKDQKCMSVVRSLASVRAFDCSLGPREQLNKATHWLDLSVLYGSTPEQANNLRTFTGGQLKALTNTRTGELYFALNQTVQCKYSKYSARYFDRQQCYITGDQRSEDNAVLTSLLTIFLRVHNTIASGLSTIAPAWNDERLYQETRRIVIAIYQNIVYSEFLPAVIGRDASISFGLPTLQQGYFTKYSPSIYPQVINEFATAAVRVFETMVPLEQSLIGRNKQDKVCKSISYFFFNNQLYERQMTPIVRGLVSDGILSVKPNMNKYFQDWLWNELFYDEDTKRWSMSAVNIQKGRDHGLASYNKYRRLCGLREAKSFSDLTNIPDKTVQRLKSVYKSVDEIDLFVGVVSEKPLKHALVGQTAACIIGKQFRDLKFGDRFYFENGNPVRRKRQTSLGSSIPFTLPQLDSIRGVTLSQLLGDTVLNAGPIQRFALFEPTNTLNPSSTQTNSLNLTLWAEGGDLFNCSYLFTTGSTQASFTYSPTNSSDSNLQFTLSYSNLQNTGLSQSNIDVKCFPFNRTAIVTITGNQPTANLQFSSFGLVTNNASFIIYVNNFNSVDMGNTTGTSDNSSSLALQLSSVQTNVVFAALNFDVYDKSTVDLHINDAGTVSINGSSNIKIFDQSAFSHSVVDANNLIVGNLTVLTNFTLGTTNQTQVNFTLIYQDISSVLVQTLSIDPKAGGFVKVLIDNLDTLSVTNRILIYPSSSSGLWYVNTNVNLTVNNINTVTIERIFMQPRDTFNMTVQFTDIQYLTFDDNLTLRSTVNDTTAVTDSRILFQDIHSANLVAVIVRQTNSGNLKLDFSKIDNLTMVGSDTQIEYTGTGVIKVAVTFSQIGSANIDEIKWNVPSAGSSSEIKSVMEKIDSLYFSDGVVFSSYTQPVTIFSFVDLNRVNMSRITAQPRGTYSNFLLDRINRLVLRDNLEFYLGKASSDLTVGNHSVTIRNIGPLSVGRNFYSHALSGQSLFTVSNVSNLSVFDKFEFKAQSKLVNGTFNMRDIGGFSLTDGGYLISDNSTAVVNYGPGIRIFQSDEYSLTTTTNTSKLEWNLYNMTGFNITDKIQGSIVSVVNVSLYSVASTRINQIANSVISSSSAHLFFNLFDLSNYFKVTNNPTGAGTRLNTVNKPGCSCQSITSI